MSFGMFIHQCDLKKGEEFNKEKHYMIVKSLLFLFSLSPLLSPHLVSGV